MPRLLIRLGYWLHWRREQAELREEMAAHRALAGARAMGNEWNAAEDARGIWLWPWLEAAGQGLRLGARRLRRAPGFAAAAVLTLALGIGASTAVFSVAEAVLLHALPYPGADRMVAFNLEGTGVAGMQAFNVPQFVFLRDHVRGLGAMALYADLGAAELRIGGHTAWPNAVLASDGFFSAFGVTPRLGRSFARADTAAGAGETAILTDGLWRRGFGADPDVIGRTIAVGGKPATVIGVLPRRFRFLEQPADLFLAYPVGARLQDDGLNESIVARLVPGASLRQLRAELSTMAPAMRAARLLPPWSSGVGVAGYQRLQTQAVAAPLWLLLAGAGLLLLIACANVAGLVVARALARQPEIAMRRALGAGRGRLLLQFLSESLVLAAGGVAVGIAMAAGLLRALPAQVSANLPLAVPVALDGRVLAVAAGAGLIACLVFGGAAAAQTRERRLVVVRFGKRGWARDVLVAGQVALTLVLLSCAALLLQSLRHIAEQPLGFQPAGRTLFATYLPAAAAEDPAHVWDFDRAVLDRLNALPGVQAAVVDMPPLAGQNNIPGEDAADPRLASSLEFRAVSPGYFAVLGIPLRRGRGLGPSDSAAAAPVALVSASLAARWYGGRALAHQLRMGAFRGKVYSPDLAAKPMTIVGVVGDVKVQDVRRATRLTVYVPAAQWPQPRTWWVVRGPVSEAQVRAAVAQANAGARVGDVLPYPALIASTLAQPHLLAQLASAFAGLALALTAVGLFGLLAFRVGERTREIGIRMALGARASRVAWSIAGRGLALALAGAALGWVAALPLRPLLGSLLFGVQPSDPAVMLAATALLLSIAAAACYLPARRATRVDASIALRQD